MKEVFIVLCIVTTIFLVSVFGVFLLEKEACSQKSKLMNKQHSYGALQGCMIVVDGEWITLEAYQSMNLIRRFKDE